MLLKTSDGRSFALHVDRYEHPDEELGPTEDNPADEFETERFLIVTVTFCNAEGSWSATAPEMTTTELARLADWLDSVAAGKPSREGVYFTERDLEFGVASAERRLFVHASWDFRPPWSGDPHATTTIAFPLDEIDLAAAIASLRDQLTAFPGRPPLDKTR
jgi:hypothetical protein